MAELREVGFINEWVIVAPDQEERPDDLQAAQAQARRGRLLEAESWQESCALQLTPAQRS